MECGRVGDRLHFIRARWQIVRRNRRSISDVDELRERRAEIRIPVAAIAQIPTGIDIQMLQIR